MRLFKSKHVSRSLDFQAVYSTGKYHWALWRGMRLWKPLWRKWGGGVGWQGGRQSKRSVWKDWMEVLPSNLSWVLQEKALPMPVFQDSDLYAAWNPHTDQSKLVLYCGRQPQIRPCKGQKTLVSVPAGPMPSDGFPQGWADQVAQPLANSPWLQPSCFTHRHSYYTHHKKAVCIRSGVWEGPSRSPIHARFRPWEMARRNATVLDIHGEFCITVLLQVV